MSEKLVETNAELSALNRELAEAMIQLSLQTGDSAPLVQAVATLRRVRETYSTTNSPRENAEVQAALGDALMRLGRAQDDITALQSSVEAYRGAITLVSLIGDDAWRVEIRRAYAQARSMLGARTKAAQTLSTPVAA